VAKRKRKETTATPNTKYNRLVLQDASFIRRLTRECQAAYVVGLFEPWLEAKILWAALTKQSSVLLRHKDLPFELRMLTKTGLQHITEIVLGDGYTVKSARRGTATLVRW